MSMKGKSNKEMKQKLKSEKKQNLNPNNKIGSKTYLTSFNIEKETFKYYNNNNNKNTQEILQSKANKTQE